MHHIEAPKSESPSKWGEIWANSLAPTYPHSLFIISQVFMAMLRFFLVLRFETTTSLNLVR